MARNTIVLTIQIPDGVQSFDMRVARALELAAGQIYIHGAPSADQPVRTYGTEDDERFMIVLTTLEA